MKDRKADFLTAENCNREVDRLRDQLSGWQDVVTSRDAEVAELKQTCIDHVEIQQSLRQQLADSQKHIVMLLEFVVKIKEQTPEKPDYWSSCSQCERNSSEAEDVIEALAATDDLDGLILCHADPVGEVGAIDTDDDGEPSAWVNLYNDVDLGEILYRACEASRGW